MIKRFILLILLSTSCLVWADSQLQEMERGLSDSVISTKITARFAENRLLNPLKIYVSTHEGNVRLSGNVGSREAFVEALRIVIKTRGVKHVDTEDLHIGKSNTAFTDAFITARVEAAVLSAKVLDDESIPLIGINAHTENGVVTLTGELPGYDAASALLKRINRIKGVKKIISHLSIKDDKT